MNFNGSNIADILRGQSTYASIPRRVGKFHAMVVGIGTIELFIGESRSLKEKRSVIRKVIHRTQNTFSLAIAEVGEQDNWKRCMLGFAVVGNNRGFIESKMASIVRFVEELYLADVIDISKEIITVSRRMGDTFTQEGKFDDN